MKFSDLIGIRNKAVLKLVRKQEFADDQFVFEFEANGLRWRPGEHALFTMPARKIDGRKWRLFSIASVPREGIVRIATKISDEPSSFKANLKNLKITEAITMRGPFGWFYRRDAQTPMVMVALGVGITPVIAIAEQQASGLTEASMHITYAARTEHLFKNALDKAAELNPKITVDYVKTSAEVNESLDKQIAIHHKDAYYYLSGAPAAVKTLRKRLRKARIPRSRIIQDSYFGY